MKLSLILILLQGMYDIFWIGLLFLLDEAFCQTSNGFYMISFLSQT
jgi:hypothetical protein